MVLDNAWGALPVAVPLLGFVAHRLAWLVFRQEDRAHRAAGTVVGAMALVHASVGLLGHVGLVSSGALLLVLALTAVVLLKHAQGRRIPSMWPGREGLPALGLGLATLSIAVVSARLLPVWQWDAFGYHLPFVNFVLQSSGFAGVPADLRYISTYPHNIELGMVWLRAMLPDDRLVDLAQVAYGAGGAVVIAALGRRLGASKQLALLGGAAWLTLPGVFLQLPTNYVDVGTATALLAALFFLAVVPATPRALVVGSLVRRRAGWLALALAATLLSPDPSVARYVLAFPALLLALASAEVSRMPRLASMVAVGLVLALGAFQVGRAVPGLSGDGPPWSSFFAGTDKERRVALGPNGRPSDYPPAWALVGDGESMAFDADFEFPGLLWDPRLSYPVYAVPAGVDLASWVDARRVRVLAIGPSHRALVDREPGRWRWLFDCRSAACAVFARTDPSPLNTTPVGPVASN